MIHSLVPGTRGPTLCELGDGVEEVYFPSGRELLFLLGFALRTWHDGTCVSRVHPYEQQTSLVLA